MTEISFVDKYKLQILYKIKTYAFLGWSEVEVLGWSFLFIFKFVKFNYFT